MDAAGPLEGGLVEALGKRGEQGARDARPLRRRVARDRDLGEGTLAADPAGRAGVEAATAGVAQQRPLDLDHVRGELGVEAGGVRLRDQPLAEEKAERQLLVVPGRAHRDADRLAVDADLERLLDRNRISPPFPADLGIEGRAGPEGVGDSHRISRR